MKKTLKLILAAIVAFAIPAFSSFALEPKTPEEIFFVEYTKMQMKTQNRIQLLQKKSNIAKLGTEEVVGYKTGTIRYKTVVEGMSGVCTITWTNYCDDSGWTFNGNVKTKANMNGDGTLSGTMKVTGKYNATVIYDNITLKNSTAGGGTYGVILEGGKRVELPYTWYEYAMTH